MDNRVDGIEDDAAGVGEGLDGSLGSIVRSGPGEDISFKETPGGYEIRYSDHMATEYGELVDQSADWLEDQGGVLNLGLVDQRRLIADGHLTAEIRDGLKAWWASKGTDLNLK